MPSGEVKIVGEMQEMEKRELYRTGSLEPAKACQQRQLYSFVWQSCGSGMALDKILLQSKGCTSATVNLLMVPIGVGGGLEGLKIIVSGTSKRPDKKDLVPEG